MNRRSKSNSSQKEKKIEIKEHVPAPIFQYNPKRYELWSIEIPNNLQIDKLNDVKLALNNQNNKPVKLNLNLADDDDDDVDDTDTNAKYEYVFSKLNKQNTNDFVLIKTNTNDNETTAKSSLKATPFDKHFKIEHIPKKYDRLKTAPDITTAPKVTNNDRFKLPYSARKQITINKNRRWMPLGCTNGELMFNNNVIPKEEDQDDSAEILQEQSNQRKRKHNDDDDDADNNNDRKKRKKEKKEKKENKKRKKEEKRKRRSNEAVIKME